MRLNIFLKRRWKSKQLLTWMFLCSWHVAWNRVVQFYISVFAPSKMKSFVSWRIFGRADRETVCIMSGRRKWVTVLFMRSFVSFKSLLPRCWHWTWVISNKRVLQKIESLEGRKSWAKGRHSPTTCFSLWIWEQLLIALFPVTDFSQVPKSNLKSRPEISFQNMRV